MPGAAQTRWGWHRLEAGPADRLVRRAGIQPGQLVLDVGAGDGAITAPLLRSRAKVLAFELHPGRAQRLRERFAGDAVIVVEADVADLRLPRQPFRVVANPPFAVTTALLRRLLAPGSRLVRADLIVPVPVAVRWASYRGPGARRWAAVFEARVATHLSRDAFRPPAPRPPAVLVIQRR